MPTKIVYLHSNGNLIIGDRSEFFEPSYLVEEQFRIEEAVADSDDFRRIVDLHNERVKDRILMEADIDKFVEDRILMEADIDKLIEDRKTLRNIAIKRDEKLQRIKNLSFWKRLFKKNILKIIGNEIILD